MTKKYYRVLSVILAITIFLTACTNSFSFNNNHSKNETEATTIELVEKDLSDTPNASKVQLEFSKLMEDLFFENVTANLISLHSSLDYPEKMGITDCKDSIGDFTQEYKQELINLMKKYVSSLENIDYRYLNSNQRLLYDIFLIDLKDSIALENFYWFSDYISPLNGTPSSIPSYLGQFSFQTASDVQDYIRILELLPEYYNNMMAFEKEKADRGYAKPDFHIEDAIAQCKEFINSSDTHYLIEMFNTKISSVTDLSATEKEYYIKKNSELINHSIIPSYENMITELSSLKGKCKVNGGLCQYNDGSDYFEALFRLNTNTDKTVSEVKQILEVKFEECLNDYYNLFKNNPDIFNKIENVSIDTSNPDKILADLITKISNDFPDGFETDYNLEYVPKALEKYQSPAYYYIPTIDNITENNIYINKSKVYEGIDFVALLAHEAFPGHMYQSTYFYNTFPDKVRSTLFFTGYLEGWGLYSELYSYKLMDLDNVISDFLQLGTCVSYYIYCIADIGINYEGWLYEDTVDFLTKNGYDESIAADIYETLISDPCSYLPYFVGYLELIEMRDLAKNTLGDKYNIKDFHKFILDIGPAPFEIIKERLDSWLSVQKTDNNIQTDNKTN